jgi:hypothetical protein
MTDISEQRNSNNQLIIKPEYSLDNVNSCLSMWLDCAGTTQKHLRVPAIKFIVSTLDSNHEFTRADVERFQNKYYLEMKNK